MSERQYKITLTGNRDLLLHHDNLAFEPLKKQWQTDSANREKSVAGDDRTPAWTWIGYIYHDADKLVINHENLMTTIREGAKRVSTGKRGATFKAQSQSGIHIPDASWPLLVEGVPIPWAEIQKIEKESDFSVHEKTAEKLGFELFVKRARVGTAKHVRVRPRFTNWSCAGIAMVLDDTIKQETLSEILANAGRFAGLGDWRPSSPKSPGPFGTFTATVEAV